ncbi:hypothetical protein GX50_02196 [[Emmonsia] crescens]|uniref:Uncharacterized protein n=1 Tax=[Emmonsia] crescens TaxID=73230 RepID=A0A2B7ZP39_9EURO|nr:hypothetical protein GX50_02196 [Emmonsia crescens]
MIPQILFKFCFSLFLIKPVLALSQTDVSTSASLSTPFIETQNEEPPANSTQPTSGNHSDYSREHIGNLKTAPAFQQRKRFTFTSDCGTVILRDLAERNVLERHIKKFCKHNFAVNQKDGFEDGYFKYTLKYENPGKGYCIESNCRFVFKETLESCAWSGLVRDGWRSLPCGEFTYEIERLKFAKGICSFHIIQQQTCGLYDELYAQINLMDHRKREIGHTDRYINGWKGPRMERPTD